MSCQYRFLHLPINGCHMIAMGETKTKSDKVIEKISNLKIVLHIKCVVLQGKNSTLKINYVSFLINIKYIALWFNSYYSNSMNKLFNKNDFIRKSGLADAYVIFSFAKISFYMLANFYMLFCQNEYSILRYFRSVSV